MSQVLVIDMGSSVVSAAVAQLTEQGRIAVKGLGRARSGGLKQGVVINIDTTVEAIRRAVTEANQMAGTKLSHALIAVGGTHLLGQDVVGQVDLNHREVTDQMLAQAMEHVQRQVEVPDRDVLSVIPQQFTIDAQTGIRAPQGMSGRHLDVHVHVITAATHALLNLKKCLKLAGIEGDVIVPSALAVSQLVLSDERDLGVCIADIGFGTTDLMVVADGAPVWTQVLPMAGELLTHDLAVAHASFAPAEARVDVQKLADRPAESISLMQLSAYLQPRVEEIVEIIGERLRSSGRFQEAATGVVLTGGTANLPGIAAVAESILQCPVRVLKGVTQDGLEGLLQDPSNAVLAGLLAYGRDQQIQPKPRWIGAQGSAVKRVRDWIKGNF
jgi:cell division protein FtsA